ncbi:MAG: mevalonate kinase [Pseudomonadota bacterium]
MRATAPGKLFLLGEYAVLEGAPAIVTSVAQQASVEVTAGTGRVCMKSGTTTSESVGKVPIIQATTRVLATRGLQVPDPSGLDFCLDTSEFFRGHDKLGLGSSAALTVALLRALVPLPANEASLALAIACHREFQGGTGSGADIAAALAGGCIEFRAGQFPRQVSLPAGIQVSFVWTGRGTGTVPYLTQLNRWRQANPTAYNELLEQLTELAESGVTACRANNPVQFIRSVAAYNSALRRLSDTSATDFYTATHVSLADIAAQSGCTYKPSGAGGGDFGVAFATAAEPIHSFATEVLALGYDPNIASLSPGTGREEPA